jgi:hypothetical protein
MQQQQQQQVLQTIMNGFHFLCIYHSINIPVILLFNRFFLALDFFPTEDLKHGSLF